MFGENFTAGILLSQRWEKRLEWYAKSLLIEVGIGGKNIYEEGGIYREGKRDLEKERDSR